MDNVTHTLAGVTLANAFFRDKVGKEAVPILAIASNIPDIDVAVLLSHSHYAITMRRTFGHSLLFLPIWTMAGALILRRFYPKVRMGTMIGMVLLGIAGHLLFDLINSFGVVLLWPLSLWRPELSIVFIIDLILAGLLVAPLLICWPKRMRPHLRAVSRASVALTACYFLLCGASRAAAARDLKNYLPLNSPAAWTYLFPEPLGPHRWRAVRKIDGGYQIFLINSLTRAVEPRGTIATQQGDPFVERVRSTAQGRRLEAFFKAPVWTSEPDGQGGAFVRAYDLRFMSLVIDRGRDGSFGYRFHVLADGSVQSE